MEAIPSFRPVPSLEAADLVLPVGQRGHMTLDFHGMMEGDRHVIIEMQGRMEDYFHRNCLFYAAARLAHSNFGPAGGDEAAGPSRDSARPPVYAIQFLNYDFRTLPREVEPDPDFVIVGGISAEKIRGVYLVRIELPSFWRCYRGPEGVTSGRTTLEWWCYVLRFSDRFTIEEIRRYERLGIPPEVVSGVASLRQVSWSETMQRDYSCEISAPIPDYAKLARVESETNKIGFLRGLLYVLLPWFLKKGSLTQDLLELLPSEIPENVVRDVWEKNTNPLKSDERYEPFLRALQANSGTMTKK
jgi:hypothetical protein